MIKVTAVGNVVKNAEVFNYSNGKGSGVSFSLACKRGFGDNETTTFLNCVMFGRDENTAQYILMGNQLVVHGDLDIQNNDGKYYTRLIVDDMEFGRKKGN